KKYGLENKGYGRDVLAVYLHQVANGVLPWPKVSKAATPAVSTTTTTTKTEPGKKPPTTPEKPSKEEPEPTPSNSSADEKRKAIV
ncbi:hypothetical protein H6F38_34275, partial [Paenibacillus sp. EKM208P]